MKKVAIMADSTISMPLEVASKYGITVMPWHAIIDGESYPDIEIDRKLLYARLKERENLPTTSGYTPEECFQFYEKLSQEAETILHISMNQGSLLWDVMPLLKLRKWLWNNFLTLP